MNRSSDLIYIYIFVLSTIWFESVSIPLLPALLSLISIPLSSPLI
nr:MAG TPA: hypothetical protein [Crassvirales sp.]